MSILTVLGYGVGALMTISASTQLLPRHVTVTRSATMATAPEAILKLAASNAGYQEFSPYKSDPSLKIELMGPTSGVGSAFKFTSDDVSGTQTVSAVSPSRVDYAIDLGPMGKPKQSIEAIADGTTTNVTWRMEAESSTTIISFAMACPLEKTDVSGVALLDLAAFMNHMLVGHHIGLFQLGEQALCV